MKLSRCGEQGDEHARAHVERYLDLLAVCLGNILTIVDPDLVVIGGGLSNFTAITTQLTDRLPRHLLPVARYRVLSRHGTVMPAGCAGLLSYILPINTKRLLCCRVGVIG